MQGLVSDPARELVAIIGEPLACPRCGRSMHFTHMELPGGRLARLKTACSFCGQVGHVELHVTENARRSTLRVGEAVTRTHLDEPEGSTPDAGWSRLGKQLEANLAEGVRVKFELDFGWLLAWIGNHMQPDDVFAEADLALWHANAQEGMTAKQRKVRNENTDAVAADAPV